MSPPNVERGDLAHIKSGAKVRIDKHLRFVVPHNSELFIEIEHVTDREVCGRVTIDNQTMNVKVDRHAINPDIILGQTVWHDGRHDVTSDDPHQLSGDPSGLAAEGDHAAPIPSNHIARDPNARATRRGRFFLLLLAGWLAVTAVIKAVNFMYLRWCVPVFPEMDVPQRLQRVILGKNI